MARALPRLTVVRTVLAARSCLDAPHGASLPNTRRHRGHHVGPTCRRLNGVSPPRRVRAISRRKKGTRTTDASNPTWVRPLRHPRGAKASISLPSLIHQPLRSPPSRQFKQRRSHLSLDVALRPTRLWLQARSRHRWERQGPVLLPHRKRLAATRMAARHPLALPTCRP